MEKWLIWTIILIWFSLPLIHVISRSFSKHNINYKHGIDRFVVACEENKDYKYQGSDLFAFLKLSDATVSFASYLILIAICASKFCWSFLHLKFGRQLLKKNENTLNTYALTSRKKSKDFVISFLQSLPRDFVVYGFETIFREMLSEFRPSSDLPLMRFEWMRYGTYKDYPSDGPSSPLKLAANGFYYTNQGHKVKCFSCKITNDVWPENESVAETHQRISPECRSGNLNVPIHEQNSTHRLPITSVFQQQSRITTIRHPEYQDMKSRQVSLKTFPIRNERLIKKIAAAGLYFTGKEDLCRCFTCGIGLKDWSEDDDPVKEHAYHSPHCNYIYQLKGGNYIEAAQRSRESRQQSMTPAIRYPEYQDMKSRQASLKTFPIRNERLIKEIAAAGLYFIGKEDFCRCFTCGIGLKNWSEDDDPFNEHAYYSPHCNYIYQLKGGNYIEAARRSRESRQQPTNSFLRNPEYEDIKSRQASFKTFPIRNERLIKKIAAAGLFFTGQGDLCRCFHCDGSLKDWVEDDDPFKEHSKHFPNCNYMNQLKRRNLNEALDRSRESVTNRQPALPSYRMEIPEYGEFQTRRMSFEAFPRNNGIPALKMALAGFFFTGEGDVCKCFSCGGRLYNWKIGDDPYREHLLHFPDCDFIKEIKDRYLITDMQVSTHSDTDVSGSGQPALLSSSTQETVTENQNYSNCRPLQILINMGYQESHIKDAFENLQNMNGNEPVTAEDIINFIRDKEPNLVDAGNTENILPRALMDLLQHNNQETVEATSSSSHSDSRCKVCLINEACIAFIPCGHLAVCTSCNIEGEFTRCIICRTIVRDTVRIYVP